MQGEPSPSDRSLLKLYLSGDKHAVATLFARYEKPLFHYLLRRLQDPDLAEETLQETFCRFLERARWLDQHPRLEGWLFSVARNVSADVCRRRRVRAAPFSDVWEEHLEAGLEDRTGAQPETSFQSRELNLLIVRILKDLPEQEREVFLLRTQSLLSFRDISRELGAPLNTVLSRMHRALKRIRRAMIQAGWVFAQRLSAKGRECRRNGDSQAESSRGEDHA
jgi:RNA polymerase sigma-70 factor (ECF subfamily)